jgi:hypothetical protein
VQASANFDGTTGLSGNGNLNVDVQWGEYNPKINTVYSVLAEEYPQLFFRVDGVEPIVNDFFGEGTFNQIAPGEELENVWWLVDFSELVESGFVSQVELDELVAENDTSNSITSDDYIAITQALTRASNEYIFTSETENMVLQWTEDLGTEEFEGVESRKYSVDINKANLEKYLLAVRDNIDATGVLQKVDEETNLSESITNEDIKESVADLDFSEVNIEAWVGLDNKVLRNLRFSPTDTTGEEYIELSLLLDGTDLDTIPIRMRTVNKDEDNNAQVDIQWNTNVADNISEFSVDASIDYTEPTAEDVLFEGKITVTGLAEEPAVEIPAGSKSFIELLNRTFSNAQQVLGITSDNEE